MQPFKAVQQFNYGHGYASKVQFVAVQPVYSLALAGDHVRAKNAVASAEESLARIAEAAEQMAAAAPTGPSAPSTPPTPAPRPGPSQPTEPPVTPETPTGSIDVPALLVARCASCHSGPEAQDGFQLFESDQKTMLAITGAKAVWIESVTYDNFMPQGGPPFSDQEYTELRRWLHQWKDPVRKLARENDR